MSKASAATKAAATALMGRETVKQGQMVPSVRLLWDAAIKRVRGGKRERKRALAGQVAPRAPAVHVFD